jgi:hypothetical protein
MTVASQGEFPKKSQFRGISKYADKAVICFSFPVLLFQVVCSMWLLGEDYAQHGSGPHDSFFLAKPSTYLLLNNGDKMPAIGLGTLPAWYLPDYKPELVTSAVISALRQGYHLHSPHLHVYILGR